MITCTFENGGKASLRHVVVDVLVIHEGKILLVKRAAHLSNPGKYGLVGGYVDRDETTKGAAIREVQEETGYLVAIDRLLHIIDSPDRPAEDRQNISFVYVASVKEKVSKPDDESSEVAWFDLEKLPTESEFAFDHYKSIKSYLNE